MAKARRGKGQPPASVRTLITPVESFSDVHADEGPYTDAHGDGDVYTDHADQEHHDFVDQHNDTEPSARDPIALVTQTIERLSAVVARFQTSHRARLDTAAADTRRRLEQIDARLTALEKLIEKR